jgi:hypothetical protein
VTLLRRLRAVSVTLMASGAAGTAQGIGLPPREAIRFFLGKTLLPSAQWSEVWQAAHVRGFAVAGAQSEALLGDFRAEIQRALEQGTTLADFRRAFDDIVARHGWVHNGSAAWRSRIIYETNLSMAYSAGRYAQMTEPETLAAFPFWQYVHSGARHPRQQHLAWNGLTLRADDAFWRTHYPPNGWRCGCRVRPLSTRDLARQGKAGPDTAPPLETRPWTRPADGQVLQVPVGIDPGFGYNVGEAWRGPPDFPGATRFTPPPGWMPRPPGLPIPETPSFTSVAEADAALRPLWVSWGSGLPAVQADAIAAMKGAFGRDINAWLRGTGDGVENVDKIVRRLDDALSAAPRMPLDLRVFRGIDAEQARRLSHLGVGDQLTTEGFLATSAVRAVAEDYARRGNGVVVEIIIRRGQRAGAYVHPFPTYRYPQAEVLLRRRLGMRVVQRMADRIVFEIDHDNPKLSEV